MYYSNQTNDDVRYYRHGKLRRHHSWLRKFWPPKRESYAGLGEGYTSFEWKKAFAAHDPKHPKIARFMADAMRVFAERELE